jgi:hypothetical protein
MKRFIFIIVVSAFFQLSFAQLNPINNLNYTHTYDYPPPANWYTLQWEIPNPSIDTLVGYNIYGGNELYKFQTYIGINCLDYDSTDCDFFLNFLTIGEDYMKVTALYNSSNEESIANDSILFEGPSQKILNNLYKNTINIFPNPATSFITINIKEGIPIEEVIIYNHLGQKALVAVPVNNTVDVSTLTPGIYFVEIATKEWRERIMFIKQ